MTNKIRKEGGRPEFYKVRGWAYGMIDSVKQSIADYTMAIKLDKNDCNLYERRGETYLDNGQYDLSIKDYSMAIKICPDSLDSYVSRGSVYGKKAQFSKELADYNYVLTRNSRYELALRNRAVLYCTKLGNDKQGFTDWDALLSINPSPKYYYERGLIYKKKGRFREAISDFSKSIDSSGGSDDNYFSNRGYCFGRVGDYASAMRDFSTAEGKSKNNPYLYRYRGEILMLKGDKNGACNDFNRAVKLGLKVSQELIKKSCEEKDRKD